MNGVNMSRRCFSEKERKILEKIDLFLRYQKQIFHIQMNLGKYLLNNI